MAFVSAFSEAQQNGRSGVSSEKLRIHGKRLFFRSAKSGKRKDGTERMPQLIFVISADLMKEARLIFGDRIDVLFDKEARLGLIKRMSGNDGGGWKLTPNGGNSKHGSVSISHRNAFPLPPKCGVECENVSVNDEGVLFIFPESVVFTPHTH